MTKSAVPDTAVVQLSDEDIEKISERAAELLLQKLDERLLGQQSAPKPKPKPPAIKLTVDDFASLNAFERRLGRTQT